MPRAPSGSPPYHNGFMPNYQPFASKQYTATPVMPYYDQQYQQGMVAPMTHPYEAGLGHNMWYQNYQQYYQGQQDFHTPFPYSGYPTDPKPHYFDHSMKERSTGDLGMGHGGYSPIGAPGVEPIYWQSPPPQYMIVPQNSPTLGPVNQGEPQTGSGGFQKFASPPQPKRHRGTTIPGADAPSLRFFEGSRKPAWGPNGDSRPSPQRGEGQKTGHSKNDSHSYAPRGSSPGAADSKQFRRPLVSQDARNFPAPARHTQQQSYASRHGEILHTSPGYNNEGSPPRVKNIIDANIRKPHFTKPMQNICWVEMKPGGVNTSGNFGNYAKPLSGPNSATMSPTSTSPYGNRSSSPLIVTSVPYIATQPSQSVSARVPEYSCAPNFPDSQKVQPSVSQCTVDNLGQSGFTFDPTAADFVFVSSGDSPKDSQADEYVGFYINPEAACHFSPTDASPFVYDCDPMAWQVPDILTSPKSQTIESCGSPCGNQPQPGKTKSFKQFIGKAPSNMNWSKEFTPIVSEKAPLRSWVNLDSEDETAILGQKIESGTVIALDENKGRLGTALGVVGSLVVTEAASNIRDNKSIRDGDQKAPIDYSTTKAEVAQTVDGIQVFGDGPQNIVKFPGCASMQPDENRTQIFEDDVDCAQGDSELAAETKGLIGDSNPLGNEDIVKPQECDSDKKAVEGGTQCAVKSFGCVDYVGNFKGNDQHAIVDKPQECFQDEGAAENCAGTPIKQEVMLGVEPGVTPGGEQGVTLDLIPGVGSEVRLENEPEAKPQVKKHAKRKAQKSRSVSGKKSGPKVEEKRQAKKASSLTPLSNSSIPKLATEVTGKGLTPDTPIIPTPDTNETREALVSAPDSSSVPRLTAGGNEQESAPAPASDSCSIPKSAVSKTVTVRPFNYRDALLKKVDNPQMSILPSSKINNVTSNSITTPVIPMQPAPAKVKVFGPATETGGRRKFFLHPIPTTATYDSVTQQLKGGMLEDIYISGLSPHPSAWKGPRGTGPQAKKENQLSIKDSKYWYGHVSFYSSEGAQNFWELVHSGKESSSGAYQSPYGGFDDQQPGFFILGGLRVLVNWRHNDQRVINPLTEKAVLQENATRCLLLTFNAETAMGSRDVTQGAGNNQEAERKAGKSIKATAGDELDFVNKVAADIQIWGQADSNLQGICILHDNVPKSEHLPAQQPTVPNPTNNLISKDVKVLVSFIKLLTATKLKRYFSTRSEYGPNGYCKVEYYKDECAEPIDLMKAVREGSVMGPKSAGRGSYEQRRKRNSPRAERENLFEGNSGKNGNAVGGKGKRSDLV